jgi:hypothetical protein
VAETKIEPLEEYEQVGRVCAPDTEIAELVVLAIVKDAEVAVQLLLSTTLTV